MAGNEHRVIAHGPQTLGDAVNQVLVIALRKIRATNAAGKQHIAHERALDLRRIKHHMPRRMARAMPHLQGVRAQGHRITVLQPSGRLEGFGGRESILGSGLGQTIDPELIAWMWADDGQLQPLSQFGRRCRVVHMRMGDPNLLQFQTQLVHCTQQQIEITPRVDHRGLMGHVVPHQGGVLLERGHRDGLVLQHGIHFCLRQRSRSPAFERTL